MKAIRLSISGKMKSGKDKFAETVQRIIENGHLGLGEKVTIVPGGLTRVALISTSSTRLGRGVPPVPPGGGGTFGSCPRRELGGVG